MTDKVTNWLTEYKQKLQLVASAVIASQQIPALSVTLVECAGQSAVVMSPLSAQR